MGKIINSLKKEVFTIKRRVRLLYSLGVKGTIISFIYLGIIGVIFYTSINLLIKNDFVLVAFGAFATLVTDNLMRNMAFLSNNTRKTKSVYKLNFEGEEILSFVKLFISLITISILASKKFMVIISPYIIADSELGFNIYEFIAGEVIFLFIFILLLLVAMKFIEFFYSKKKEWYVLDKRN